MRPRLIHTHKARMVGRSFGQHSDIRVGEPFLAESSPLYLQLPSWAHGSAFKVTKQLLKLQPSLLCSRQQEGEEDGKAKEQVSHLSQLPTGAEHPREHYLNLTGQHLVTRPYLIVWEAGKCSLILAKHVTTSNKTGVLYSEWRKWVSGRPPAVGRH